MNDFRSPAIAGLARQLERGPVRLRLRQLMGIEFVLSVVETGKAYPADFVWHALTGYRPSAAHAQTGDGVLIEGEVLVGDLVTLAEKLSEDSNIAASHWTTPIYSIAELAERFDVSTKTIFRWRRRGLVGWKFRYPDRRARLAFPEPCVRRFVAQHTELVQRGSGFSQLSKDERQHIIVRARCLREEGYQTVNAAARVLARETGRAVETIRLILKAYDETRPGAGIFNRSAVKVAQDDRQLPIWEAYLDGASVPALAARFGQPVAWVYRIITQMRARELKGRTIEYVRHPDFASPDADERILNHPAALNPYRADLPAPRHIPADLPPYLQQLFRLPLLTKEGEAALFCKLNYLKYKADRLRQEADPETVTAAELDRIERLLEEAQRVKNQITQANLRLVVSIAKRHMAAGLDFFELISDGNMSLMRAVDKFDFGRGFKFSTYASWAVMRNYARMVPERRHHLDRYQTGRDELLENVAEPPRDEHDDEQVVALRGAIERMLDTLDQRERRILRQRYGLDDRGQTQTLEQIGRRLGVSKERVRQLESRAIHKLRHDFAEEVQKLLGI